MEMRHWRKCRCFVWDTTLLNIANVGYIGSWSLSFSEEYVEILRLPLSVWPCVAEIDNKKITAVLLLASLHHIGKTLYRFLYHKELQPDQIRRKRGR